MKKKKIVLCWGTRPEVLKMTSLALALRGHKRFNPTIIFTGQHRAMAHQVMRLFRLRADYHLEVMTANQDLSSLSEKILKKMDRIFKRIHPDLLLVQGDTTTAFLCALAAFYHKIPVGHVEAGLRTDDKYQPFPEEMNRRLISQIAEFHFAPTETARKRLCREGIPKSRILRTGNTGIDALMRMNSILKTRKQPPLKIPDSKKIVLVTAHRRESFGRPLKNICLALRRLATQMPEIAIYYPVHLNPNVNEIVRAELSGIKNIHLLKPMTYDEIVYLMSRAHLILTDSGGIQEEAPSFHKPILVMREKTERPEGVKAGFSIVVGQNPDRIFREARRLLLDPRTVVLRAKKNPYGDGKAAYRIIRFLESQL